jgi:hypothetical protein
MTNCPIAPEEGRIVVGDGQHRSPNRQPLGQTLAPAGNYRLHNPPAPSARLAASGAAAGPQRASPGPRTISRFRRRRASPAAWDSWWGRLRIGQAQWTHLTPSCPDGEASVRYCRGAPRFGCCRTSCTESRISREWRHARPAKSHEEAACNAGDELQASRINRLGKTIADIPCLPPFIAELD